MKDSRRAFTLIELLVVIAIIGILATIILASLSSARMYAQATKVVAEIKMVEKAITAYYFDTGEMPPFDLAWSETCERAIFITGTYTPKPSNWTGPYLSSWPQGPAGGIWTWDDPHHIVIQPMDAAMALTIDRKMDDGNVGAGKAYFSGIRFEYNNFDTFPTPVQIPVGNCT